MYLILTKKFIHNSNLFIRPSLAVDILIAASCYLISYFIGCSITKDKYNDELRYIILCVIFFDVMYQYLDNKQKTNNKLKDVIPYLIKKKQKISDTNDSILETSLSFSLEDFKVSNESSQSNSDINETSNNLFEKL